LCRGEVLKLDNAPVPQFNAIASRRWVGRRDLKATSRLSDGVAGADLSGLFEVLAKLIAAVFQHHH
jgi:hypothetical protein